MKVYLVYQYGYNGSDFMEILGVFNNLETAEKLYNKIIADNVAECDFVIDDENNFHNKVKEVFAYQEGKGIKNKHCDTRLFWRVQENWDNYLEIHIEEQEVK